MSKHVKKLFTLAAIALLIFISSCQYQEQSNTGSITSELMEQAEVVGGDMIFVDEEAGSKGTMRRTTKTWAMGHIMFTFDPSVGPINMATIRSAMAKWSAEGRINFMEVPCNPRVIDDWRSGRMKLYYIYGDPNYSAPAASTVGYQSKNYMIIRDAKMSARTALHELGHALGLHHEHQRWDRDKYITIQLSNIQPAKKSSYELLPDTYAIAPAPYGSYDYTSIMHYYKYSGNAIDQSKPVMIRKDNAALSLGGSSLTGNDRMCIKGLYR